ncbi:MAG TPA: S8 family serine peptidase [Tepidisphaeraceae bacterium]|nr:S8 family serine peptidase [Tepidisphaeraceae bacterium]
MRVGNTARLKTATDRALSVDHAAALHAAPHAAASHAAALFEPLEKRVLLSASFNVTGLTQMRSDPNFSSITGSGIGIAVLDTGVFAQNPDLRSNIVAFYNAVSNPPTQPIDPNFLNDAVDEEGHGSFTSGIAASSNPSIGVAYQAHLIDIKVLPAPDDLVTQADPVFNGLEWVAMHAAQYNIKVVNMSLGPVFPINVNSTPQLDQEGQEIQVLQNMGITVVTASGNSYQDFASPGQSPLAAESTIGAANSWADNGIGDYNFTAFYGDGLPYAAFETSAQPDIFQATSQRSSMFNQLVAPGTAIFSTWNSPTQLHNTGTGTSFAAPFIAGTVALMQQTAQKYGGVYLSPTEVLTILRNTSDPIVDNTLTTNGRALVTPSGLGPNVPLPGTGLTYDRVNVDKAMLAVKAFVQGTGGPNGDLNNTLATANTTNALNGSNAITITGNIGTDGTNVIGPNDVDIYKLVVQTPGAFTLTSQAPSGGVQFNEALRLMDSSGNNLVLGGVTMAIPGGNGTPYPNMVSPPGTFLAAGTYYLGVSSSGNFTYNAVAGTGDTGGASSGDYLINFTIASPDPGGVPVGASTVPLTNPTTITPPATAPNIAFTQLSGTIGEAIDSSGNTIAVPHGDVKMFTLVAPDSGNLILQADNTLSNGQAVIRVLDSNLNTVGSIGTNITVPVVGGQTYYIGVTTPRNENFSPNDPFARPINSTAGLVAFSVFVGFDNGDRNGTLAFATPAAVGTPVSAVIGSDPIGTFLGANGGNKDVDFYSFTAATAGVFQAVVAPAGGFAPALSLWQSPGGAVSANRLADASSNTIYDQVTAGEQVLIAVTGQGNQNFNGLTLGSGSGGSTGSYTLSTSLQPLSALATISNNSIANATPTPVALNQPITGNIGLDGNLFVGPTDVDMYKFTAPSTAQYSFTTTTQSDNSATTVIRVFDALGNQVAVGGNVSSTTTSQTVSVPMLAGQTYYIGVSGAGTNQFAYNALTGANAAAGSTGQYSFNVANAGPYQRVVNVPIGKKLTFTDAEGHKVTINLKGPGSAQVIFFSTSGNDNIGKLVVTGTDNTSVLTVTGATPIGAISISSSLGTLNARQASLTGNMTVGGGLGKFQLTNASNGAITIGAGNTLTAMLGKMTNEALTSSEAINELKVSSWATTGATRFAITAPSIKSLISTGDFNEDLSVTTISSANLGSLTASAIRASVSIGNLTAGSASASEIFAGVQSTLTTLPASASDFANVQNSSIGSVTIKGTFSNAQIAGWKVGKVSIATIQTGNNGQPFGIAGNSIQQAKVPQNGSPKVFTDLFSPLSQISLGGDAVIRLIG